MFYLYRNPEGLQIDKTFSVSFPLFLTLKHVYMNIECVVRPLPILRGTCFFYSLHSRVLFHMPVERKTQPPSRKVTALIGKIISFDLFFENHQCGMSRCAASYLLFTILFCTSLYVLKIQASALTLISLWVLMFMACFFNCLHLYKKSRVLFFLLYILPLAGIIYFLPSELSSFHLRNHHRDIRSSTENKEKETNAREKRRPEKKQEFPDPPENLKIPPSS